MNKVERMKMVKAMEFIARQVNDEEVFEIWLSEGVADGDIRYGSLDIDKNDEEDLGYYIEDGNFVELMDTFLRLMKWANKSGGLYCDNAVAYGEDKGVNNG